MHFITDKQTLDDLGIFGKPGADSVYTIFHHTHTRGGADVLEQFFRYPLTDANAITRRAAIIQYFASQTLTFPFESALFDAAEQYLANTDLRTRLAPENNTLGRKLGQLLVGAKSDYMLIRNGVRSLLTLLSRFHSFLQSMPSDTPYQTDRAAILELFSDADLAPFVVDRAPSALSYEALSQHDQALRFHLHSQLKKLLEHIYTLDVYMAVASVAIRRRMIFPRAHPSERQLLHLSGVVHPLLKNAVANTLSMNAGSNVLFLTGANMAGKSTFMKTIGIALYLAHMGFPVSAAGMDFSVRDGLFTTINLSDDLSGGYSHFYAEVQRVKSIAHQLSRGKDLFVVFDELFRGTNVRDAEEATIAIVGAFARQRKSSFIISTHILEAGEVLQQQFGNIGFAYLPTRMEGHRPVYTYELQTGISADRHGMIIIRNEKILDILKRRQTA